MKLEDLRPEFIENMLILKNHIFSSNKKKKLNGKDINGEILGALLNNYI